MFSKVFDGLNRISFWLSRRLPMDSTRFRNLEILESFGNPSRKAQVVAIWGILEGMQKANWGLASGSGEARRPRRGPW